jgi:hypothetical protein
MPAEETPFEKRLRELREAPLDSLVSRVVFGHDAQAALALRHLARDPRTPVGESLKRLDAPLVVNQLVVLRDYALDRKGDPTARNHALAFLAEAATPADREPARLALRLIRRWREHPEVRRGAMDVFAGMARGLPHELVREGQLAVYAWAHATPSPRTWGHHLRAGLLSNYQARLTRRKAREVLDLLVSARARHR